MRSSCAGSPALCRVCARSLDGPGTAFPQLNTPKTSSVPGVPGKTLLRVHGKKEGAIRVQTTITFLPAHPAQHPAQRCSIHALTCGNSACRVCAGSSGLDRHTRHSQMTGAAAPFGSDAVADHPLRLGPLPRLDPAAPVLAPLRPVTWEPTT